jgi:hypothetical protein
MNRAASKGFLAVALIVGCVGLASHASAVLLDTSSSEFMGTIVPDVPAGTDDERSYVNALVALAPNTSTTFSGQDIDRSGNTLCYPNCPAATGNPTKDDSGVNTGIDVTGFTYLLAKYDAAQGGGLVFYVADLTGDVDVQATFGTCGSGGCGLSHVTLWNVSEPGTLLLLGASLIGLGFLRRKSQ